MNKGLKQDPAVSSSKKINHGALLSSFTGKSDNSAVYVKMAAFVNGDLGYNFIEVQENPSSEDILISMVNGLQFLSQAEALKIQPARMKIHTVKNGETWASITAKYYNRNDDKSKLADYNGFTVNEMPLPGVLIKIPPTLRFN